MKLMKLEGSNLCMLVVDIMRELINKDAEGANYFKKKVWTNISNYCNKIHG